MPGAVVIQHHGGAQPEACDHPDVPGDPGDPGDQHQIKAARRRHREMEAGPGRIQRPKIDAGPGALDGDDNAMPG